MEDFKTKLNQEVTDFAKEHPLEYKLIIDKIRSYRSSDYTDNYYSFAPVRDQLIEIYINQALDAYNISRSKSLCTEITEIADYYLDRRYDVMIALDDEEAFQKVLGYATDFLKGEDFLFFQKLYVNSQSLFALVQAYYNPKFKQEVVLFFNASFEYAKNYAKENDKYPTSTSADPDGSTLLELAQAISYFKEEDREQFATLVGEIYIFSSDHKRSYEMNQASGYIAVLLTLFKTKFNMQPLNDAIAHSSKYYPAYINLKQYLYTKWVLEKNTEDPFVYLKDIETKGSLIFAIFALTDLNFKKALPLFIEKQKEEKDPVIQEIYDEAIHRLESGYIPTIQTERMIWLNGNLTPTQRALGAENDNVFVKRAQKKQPIDDTIYETDNE